MLKPLLLVEKKEKRSVRSAAGGERKSVFFCFDIFSRIFESSSFIYLFFMFFLVFLFGRFWVLFGLFWGLGLLFSRALEGNCKKATAMVSCAEILLCSICSKQEKVSFEPSRLGAPLELSRGGAGTTAQIWIST